MQQLRLCWGVFTAPLPQLCRILRLLNLCVDPSQSSPACWTDTAEVRAKIISRAQHKKMCSWCPPSSPSQKILPCDLTGDPSPGATASLSFLSEAPPLKNFVETCGIQMKQGRCVVAMGSSRGNHIMWKLSGVFFIQLKLKCYSRSYHTQISCSLFPPAPREQRRGNSMANCWIIPGKVL